MTRGVHPILTTPSPSLLCASFDSPVLPSAGTSSPALTLLGLTSDPPSLPQPDEMIGVHADINVPTPIENLNVGVGLLTGIDRINGLNGEFKFGPTVSIKGKF